MMVTKVGIVGFGSLGQYLYDKLRSHLQFEVVFIWNRSQNKLQEKSVPIELILTNITDFESYNADLIIEVASPEISHDFGHLFLSKCNYLIGSPAALGNQETFSRLKQASELSGKSIFVPSGAFWGAHDVQKMADLNTLKALTVTMTFHPKSLKTVKEPLKSKIDSVSGKAMVLYDGPVREVLDLAPSNVNTLATAAIAGHNLGFDGVRGVLISDPSDEIHHKITFEVTGPCVDGAAFKVMATRTSPSPRGAVTSSATFDSFFSSVLKSKALLRNNLNGIRIV